MALLVDPFPFELDGLSDFMVAAGSDLGGAAGGSDPEIEIVGPFPGFSGDPRKIASGDWSDVAPVGWRALARRNNEPVAVVEIVSVEGAPRYGLRPAEAAIAFERVLALSGSHDQSGEGYAVRWLSLPAIFVTALWLHGAEDIFIPTRLGDAERVQPAEFGKAEFEEIVRALVEPATRDVALGGVGEAADNLPGSRSGL